ncbi:bifunctional protein-serine/threonine kinase/phosphatase [Pseudorhodoferax soli]|uniref:Serine/threonine protein kinase n=1 Tax=Pseudorhodoferax soli TaxID=545864 RepID=A0A368Y6D2_9BURK|nr:bifunctional protein-serine/threonine kinase/phosphatase [Pseudorhodoferax soli]RCW75850.1 serine/threonine protein kinase [Pseudorhodoferax soli]
MPSAAPLEVTLGQHSLAGDKGLNQDFHGAVVPTGSALYFKGIAVALADGIGSSPVSQVASAAAVRGFLDDYYATSEAWSVRRAAQRVLGATNAWLHAQNQRGDARFDKDRGYCCTFSALVLKGRELHVLHVGDTRIYRVHAQALEQLTEDHRVHLGADRSYLGRALGATAHVEIDHHCLEAEAGALYLLASDGAYERLDAAAVHAALARWPDDFDAAARSLAETARARGSTDDATVQLLRIDTLPPHEAQPWQAQRAQLRLPPPLAPRMAFEGCTLVRELHASARSQVFLALDHQTGQHLVLKVPSVELREDPDALDRFLLEEWVARRVRSPHVLQAWASERAREHLFVAMAYVEGQTLAQWMTDHPRPDLDSVRGLVAQLAKGLQALHGKEMLHQDLRPENVMVDRSGTVKIIDLGSAHVAGLAEAAPAHQATRIVGSLQYTAPEYFVGGQPTAAADLFALAVLTYQMLSGQLPYGLQVTQLRQPADLKRLRYVPLRHHRPELPAWLDAVLLKALQPEPARRQEAVSEFVHDLHRPGGALLQARALPLVERDPVLFWKVCTVLLGLGTVVLAALRVLGR